MRNKTIDNKMICTILDTVYEVTYSLKELPKINVIKGKDVHKYKYSKGQLYTYRTLKSTTIDFSGERYITLFVGGVNGKQKNRTARINTDE